ILAGTRAPRPKARENGGTSGGTGAAAVPAAPMLSMATVTDLLRLAQSDTLLVRQSPNPTRVVSTMLQQAVTVVEAARTPACDATPSGMSPDVSSDSAQESE